MNKLFISLVVFMLLFFVIGCEKSIENPASTPQENVSAFLSTLPKRGDDDRFITKESMKKCQDDMEQIAKSLATTLKESQVRLILKEELKGKDAFWEISFNQLMSNEISSGLTVFDLMIENGITDFAKLLKGYPDLRLSIPEKYENSFDPFSDFNVAILPVEDERFIKEIISFDFQGNRIVLDPEILCDTPLLVLEIDENPDYHPDCPDDLYGYVFIKYWDLFGAAGYNGVSRDAYGYNSDDGGNNAWRVGGNPKKNAHVKFKLYDEEE